MQPHTSSTFSAFAAGYLERLYQACSLIPIEAVELLATAMFNAWKDQRQVFLIGNGGSAGNAIHLTNDFIFGISKRMGSGIRMHALPANQAMITCLGNDVGYENIFSHQLAVLSQSGDLLIALSGSGNSPNILNGLSQAETQGLTSFAILGFDGGKAKVACDHPIHVPVHDMQLAEDSQLIIGHMIMQWLYAHREELH
ncbi:MAG: SIS domain-containing protein [Betaproteobacteria bacterium]|nr:SIS domain-containing protein [Betaproteobacteria bacterium]